MVDFWCKQISEMLGVGEIDGQWMILDYRTVAVWQALFNLQWYLQEHLGSCDDSGVQRVFSRCWTSPQCTWILWAPGCHSLWMRTGILWWRTRVFHNWDSGINWMAVGGSQEALHPPLGLWAGLASLLYFIVSSWCRQQISEDGAAETTLTETFPSWLETLGTRAWDMPTSSSWIKSAPYSLIASTMNLTWK